MVTYSKENSMTDSSMVLVNSTLLRSMKVVAKQLSIVVTSKMVSSTVLVAKILAMEGTTLVTSTMMSTRVKVNL